MTGWRVQQTAIGRRMQAGESIPAWHPDRQAVQRPRFPAAQPAPALPLDVRPISALEAREAAQRVNAWAKTDGGEMDNATIRLLCQWVLRVTRGAT